MRKLTAGLIISAAIVAAGGMPQVAVAKSPNPLAALELRLSDIPGGNWYAQPPSPQPIRYRAVAYCPATCPNPLGLRIDFYQYTGGAGGTPAITAMVWKFGSPALAAQNMPKATPNGAATAWNPAGVGQQRVGFRLNHDPSFVTYGLYFRRGAYLDSIWTVGLGAAVQRRLEIHFALVLDSRLRHATGQT